MSRSDYRLQGPFDGPKAKGMVNNSFRIGGKAYQAFSGRTNAVGTVKYKIHQCTGSFGENLPAFGPVYRVQCAGPRGGHQIRYCPASGDAFYKTLVEAVEHQVDQDSLTPHAASGLTLPTETPGWPKHCYEYEIVTHSPMFVGNGRWYWTAYRGDLGYELECDQDGEFIEAHRVPQIDCDNDE